MMVRVLIYRDGPKLKAISMAVRHQTAANTLEMELQERWKVVHRTTINVPGSMKLTNSYLEVQEQKALERYQQRQLEIKTNATAESKHPPSK